MSKRMKEFKQRITENSTAKEKFNNKRIVKVALEENLVANIDRGKYFVSEEEITLLVKDLFKSSVALKTGTIINLDQICDVMYKLSYRGKINNEINFNIC